jgi:chromosome segregation ATPase
LFREVTKLTTKIRTESKRAQQVFESSQKKLRISVEASKKIENYRKRLTITHHTLSSKITTITKIITQITKEISIIREKISSINMEIDECTRATASARALITTLTGKHTSIEQSIKTINANTKDVSDKVNLEGELKKVESETETAQNTL